MVAIGVDSGTQGTKALVVDFDASRVLGRGRAAHAIVPGLPPGASEQDPESWSAALGDALRQALRDSRIDPSRVAVLGVSGQQHGFVPLDAAGRPIRPAKLWNDTATIAENEDLVERLGGPAGVVEKLGLGLAVGYTASKILWLKRHEPENFDALAHILLPHDYLNHVLTGEIRMEYGDASGTGLMDVRTRTWRREVLDAIDPRLQTLLPKPDPPEVPAGFLRPQIAREFGFGKVLVACGGGDNMMSAIGTGTVRGGIATLSLGTSGTISCFSDRPVEDPEGEIAGFCDGTGHWLPLACTLNVANGETAVRRLFDLDHAGLEARATGTSPGSEGVIFLPYLDGERMPALPEASGAFLGLTSGNMKPGCLARAVLEGVAMNLRYGFRRMGSLGLDIREVRATGGGSNSRIWLRIAADILQTPISVAAERESAAYGAAIQAIWCFRQSRGESVSIPDLTESFVRTEGGVIEPDPARMRVYEEISGRFDSLTRALKPEFAPLRAAINKRLP